MGRAQFAGGLLGVGGGDLAGQTETPQPIGKGGWGLGYSLTKAAFSRMVAGLAKELRPYDVAVIGLMPGFVGTERMAIELGEFGFDAVRGSYVDQMREQLRAVEEQLIRKALAQTDGNRTRAAELLELSYRALLYKIKEYGISA